jgi:hypothetical protein
MSINGQEKENPMASFMGRKWGLDALIFSQTFVPKYEASKVKDGFVLDYFELGYLWLSRIYFVFKQKKGEKRIKFKEKNYDKFFLNRVVIRFFPSQFDELYEVFKLKYGKPTEYKESVVQNRMGAKFDQKFAYWIDANIERGIMMRKFDQNLDEGIIIYMDTSGDSISIEEKRKAAAQML